MTGWDDIRDAARAMQPQGCVEARRVALGYVAFAKLIDDVAVGICEMNDHTITVEALPGFVIVQRSGRDCRIHYDASKNEVFIGGGFSAYGRAPQSYAVPPEAQVRGWAHNVARAVLSYLVLSA